EALEESEPPPVGLQPQTVELVPEGGEPLRQAPFDFGLEEAEAILRLGIGHEFHYRGCHARRKAFGFQPSAPRRALGARPENRNDSGSCLLPRHPTRAALRDCDDWRYAQNR